MKSIMLSIQPKYCELIASGKKTIEVRKTAPKDKEPFKVYIYQTKRKWIYKLLEKLGLYRGKVIGEFMCNRIDEIYPDYADWTPKPRYDLNDNKLAAICLTEKELWQYGKPRSIIYGLHITDLKIYDKPKELDEFYNPFKIFTYENSVYGCVKPLSRPPQSWCYVEELSE